MGISPSQLQQVINLSSSYADQWYALDLRNCADFAIDTLKIAGLNTSTFGVDSPNTVFNMISPGAQSTNGNAPATNRTCP